MPRFFVNTDDIREGYAYISGEDASHISFSLRMARGEEICVCDGTGMEYRALLCDFSDSCVTAKIVDGKMSDSEPRIKITLYQAYPKKDKMEFIVQKAVELGTVSIVPFESERCIKRPKEEKIDRQTARLSKIAREAAKQCGRAILPQVSSPCTFGKALDMSGDDDLRLFCYEGEGTSPICDILGAREQKEVRSVAVFVGSEGGFSENEAKAARESGCIMCGLGRRILRCETAPIFALSSLIYRYDL